MKTKKEQKMESNGIFKYSYSAEQNKEIEHIRNKYLIHEPTKAERVQQMHKKVQRAGTIQSLTLGIIGCLIFGIGMCFFLEVFSAPLYIPIILFLIGIGLMAPAYPIYLKISRNAKEKLGPEILRLSEEILSEHK